MSHYTEVEVEFDVEHKEQIIAALEEQFGEGHVEWHEEGAAMYGYQGDDRSKAKPGSANYAPRCEIIVRRKHVGGASNDLGFKLQENGKFKAWVSDYDQHSHFGKAKQQATAVKYAELVGEKTLIAKGFGQIEKVKLDDGSIKLIGRPNKVTVGTVPLKNW